MSPAVQHTYPNLKRRNKYKTKIKITDSSPYMPKITINVSGLNIPIKRWRLAE
jgi:hypothetical protein